MIACDKCLSRECKAVRVDFSEVKGGDERKRRRMLTVDLTLCEACITDLFKAFGRFKHAFFKEAEAVNT